MCGGEPLQKISASTRTGDGTFVVGGYAKGSSQSGERRPRWLVVGTQWTGTYAAKSPRVTLDIGKRMSQAN